MEGSRNAASPVPGDQNAEMRLPAYAIVMKVGVHAGESWEAIVDRKRAEEAAAGATFWGYGGTVCHPLTQVQPFARSAAEPVSVLMIRTSSDFLGEPRPASAISVDGIVWEPVPHGVRITGSRYALALRGLRWCDDELDLGPYEVAVGSMAGTPLREYLRSRVDKACARLAPGFSHPAWQVALVLRAELVAPFAVLLRHD